MNKDVCVTDSKVFVILAEKQEMKKLYFLLSGFLAGSIAVVAQSYIPITNNMQIQSYSNIKFIAGNYSFTDPELNGVIQINKKHDIILDGDSCFVDGTNFGGYMIMIDSSYNIEIRNFDSVFRYKYALYVTYSDHITVNGNDFCHNKVDSAGWIDVWADYQQALGGGAMMYESRAVHIFENTMTMQNDGVALYHCDSIRIHDNDFSWNTSFGIRMFWTDTCHIYGNNCSHVNRPFTDPSDCAALLMIISNANQVEFNDLSYSGDGVFLGQYQHSNIPNNNYFAWNECSYSPHNAIEATFADGNVYKHNNCNYSHYGFWLGYSFNSVVDSNEINGNYQSGIAIDRGFNNTITHNEINDNPIGIELWEGSPIGGYTNQYSHDYFIHNNHFEGNTLAISAGKTEHSVILDNDFWYNQTAGIYFDGLSVQDTVSGNEFRSTTMFHMKNNSTDDIYAPGNLFIPGDSLLIEEKIFDKIDQSAKGRIYWYPPASSPSAVFQYTPPCDMAEPLSTWYAYPETGYPPPVKYSDSVYFDFSEKKIGSASVKLITSRGWYLGLNYRPELDSVSDWQLTEEDTLYFWVRTKKQPQYGFQYFHIRIGDGEGNYYKYNSSTTYLNNAHLTWKHYQFPLSGGTGFYRTTVGQMTPDHINYVEFDADTWDYGFTLWIDGCQFEPCEPITGIQPPETPQEIFFTAYPNPFNGKTTIAYEVPVSGHVNLSAYDLYGRLIETLINKEQSSGIYEISFPSSFILQPIQPPKLQRKWSSMYLLRLTTSTASRVLTLIQLK